MSSFRLAMKGQGRYVRSSGEVPVPQITIVG
jgi:hypothetical protein